MAFSAFAAALMLSAVQTAPEPTGAATLGACAWDRLPSAQQEAVLSAYDQNLQRGMNALHARDGMLQLGVVVCAGRDDLPSRLTQGAIAAHVIQTGAARALERDRGLSHTRLEEAWATAPQAARDCTLRNAARPFRIEGPACGDRHAPKAFLEALGLSERTDRRAATQALVFMNAKAQSQIAQGLIDAALRD